jgi:peptidoglycan/LPS O-acetylase OafA/YrhL
MRTLGSSMADHNGKAVGSDTLRVILAFGVILHHSIPLTLGPSSEVAKATTHIGDQIMVPMFIVLSGFLVTASALRTSLIQFTINRGLRIFPGLVVVTMVTAVILGPALTTLPLSEYFARPDFWRYWSNAVAWVRYPLPGVFETNPVPVAVNGSLWSIPVELQCYSALIAMILVGLLTRASWILAIFGGVLILNAIPFVIEGKEGLHFTIANFLKLFVYFMGGVVAYLYKDKIPFNAGLLWAAIGLAILLLFADWRVPVMPIIMTYCTVGLALSKLPPPLGYSGSDYSYGIYIYGFPVQQMMVLALPSSPWWLNVLVTTPVVLALAMASWHFVEKPALQLKPRRHVPRSVRTGTHAKRYKAPEKQPSVAN